MILHALEKGLDRFGPEVLPRVAAGERVRLVDEEDAVEGPPDRAVGLDRRRADVLADEAGAVDLDEMAALEQAHRAIHLREQARDGRLPRARVAEEDEMLTRRHLGESVLLPPRLHLEERDERANLLLHRLEPDQRVELGLQLVQGLRLGLGPRHAELIRDVVADGLPDALAERSKRVGRVLEWARAHGRTVPGRRGPPWPFGSVPVPGTGTKTCRSVNSRFRSTTPRGRRAALCG